MTPEKRISIRVDKAHALILALPTTFRVMLYRKSSASPLKRQSMDSKKDLPPVFFPKKDTAYTMLHTAATNAALENNCAQKLLIKGRVRKKKEAAPAIIISEAAAL